MIEQKSTGQSAPQGRSQKLPEAAEVVVAESRGNGRELKKAQQKILGFHPSG
jgi:hypothetical protein